MITMTILLLVSNGIGSKYYSQINSIVNTITLIWLGLMMYLFIASIILLPLSFIFKTAPLLMKQIIMLMTLVITVGVSWYGLINSIRPRVVTMEVVSPVLAPLWKDKTIVLFSDTHLGMVRGEKFAQKVSDLVNTQNPDLVLLAGDMIDGPTIPYETFAQPFSTIRATHGVYYTPGNHEWYNTEPEKFISAMRHVTSALIDEKTLVNGTQIIGINYGREFPLETKARLAKTGFDKTIPSIALLHDPMNNDALIEEGVSLVVSGHTHCGQFWPFSFIVSRIYKDKTYGVRQLENGATLTTCGIGTAQIPFRIGNHPEIVVVKIIE